MGWGWGGVSGISVDRRVEDVGEGRGRGILESFCPGGRGMIVLEM